MNNYKYFELNFDDNQPDAPRYRVVFVNPQSNRLHNIALLWSESRANWIVDLLNESKTYHQSEVEQ